jgi:hypothetical protein
VAALERAERRNSGMNESISPAVLDRGEGVKRVIDGLDGWLYGSTILYPEGAVAAWWDSQAGQRSYPYPEITGYFLTYSAYSGTLEDPGVHAAAMWLRQWAGIGSGSRLSEPNVFYNFDSAIAATGLINVGELYREPSFVDAGIRLVSRLTGQIEKHAGLPTIDPQGSASLRSPTWSTRGQYHLLKAVQALTLGATYCDAAKSAAQTLMDSTLQRPLDLETEFAGPGGEIYLHPLCYAIEGLWIWSKVTQSDAYLLEANRLYSLVLESQLISGGFPRWAGGEALEEQADVGAQAVRLGYLLGREDELVCPERLTEIVVHAPGGLAVPYRPESGLIHANTWASMFTAQALRLADGQELEWRHLV